MHVSGRLVWLLTVPWSVCWDIREWFSRGFKQLHMIES